MSQQTRQSRLRGTAARLYERGRDFIDDWHYVLTSTRHEQWLARQHELIAIGKKWVENERQSTGQYRLSQPPPAITVRTVSFQRCACRLSGFDTDHLGVSWSEALLADARAVAISYAIGDYDRQIHVFAHYSDDVGRRVELSFGNEWNIEGLMNVFVDLTLLHGGIWFDQLSIPQTEAEIAEHLQRIPDIYRCLPVVVLLPNAPCGCLANAVVDYTAGRDNDSGPNVVSQYLKCLHAFPMSSYYSRLWTKLELTYATEASVHYGWPDDITGFAQLEGPYFTSLFHEIKDLNTIHPRKGYSTGVRLRAHIMQAHTAFTNALADGRDALCLKDRVTAFLLGETSYRTPDRRPAYYFAYCRTFHRATVTADMVTAYLIKDRLYRIPDNFRQLSAPRLLEDGLGQCERQYRRRHLTCLPSGLMSGDDPSPSTKFRPSLCKSSDEISSMSDLYAALQGSFPIMVWDGHVPLNIPQPYTRISQATTFEAAFDNLDRFDALELLDFTAEHLFGQIMLYAAVSFPARDDDNPWLLSDWANDLIEGQPSTETLEDWPSEAHEQAFLVRLLLSGKKGRGGGSVLTDHERIECLDRVPKIDFHRVCYTTMCQVLGVDVQIARAASLGLVVHYGYPSCLGLFNSQAHAVLAAAAAAASESAVQGENSAPATFFPHLETKSPIAASESWLTIHASMQGDPSTSQTVTYEALRTPKTYEPPFEWPYFANKKGQHLPVYRVVGVWLSPPNKQQDQDVLARVIEAVNQPELWNATVF